MDAVRHNYSKKDNKTMIERENIIQRAREKYILTGITKNITEALAAYLDNDAGEDERIPLWISSPEIHQVREILKQVRPQCDECGSFCHLQIHARDPSGKCYPTSWICKNCGLEYFSDKTPAEWLKELQDEIREQNLQRPDERIQPNVPNMRAETPI